ncbi:formate dehydrogenase accessory sulfurtransferase FdhD [Ostreibacterium oceani]|nr:formate dehydrogenase accessory sulfurtransferase FdhD [Ostreibacterium oceani]
MSSSTASNLSAQHTIDIITDSLPATVETTALSATGETQTTLLVQEHPLTLYLNRVEIVTLMTMGNEPHYLVVGFLLHQHLIESVDDISAIHIDWSVHSAAVSAKTTQQIEEKTNSRVVTSGCGQGTMFSHVMDNLPSFSKHNTTITTAQIYELLAQLAHENTIYRQAGAVHSCALCTHDSVIKSVEDVGRHNAIDALGGYIALESPQQKPTVMYTTGRLTSEMVIKTVQMQIPILLSRSGATAMGVAVGKAAGVMLISRAKGRSFSVLTEPQRLVIHQTE